MLPLRMAIHCSCRSNICRLSKVIIGFRSLGPTAASGLLAWRCSKNGLEEPKKELCPFACSEALFARGTRLPTEGADKCGDVLGWQQMPKLARDVSNGVLALP